MFKLFKLIFFEDLLNKMTNISFVFLLELIFKNAPNNPNFITNSKFFALYLFKEILFYLPY